MKRGHKRERESALDRREARATKAEKEDAVVDARQ